MSFRLKILLAGALTVAIAVWAVVGAVSAVLTRSFEQRDAVRTAKLVEQFHREFERRGEEVARRIESVANSEVVARIAAKFSESQPDTASNVDDAQALAQEQSLDFLELVAPDGSIISSAQWPARFGYKELWLTQAADWKSQSFFFRREELPEGSAVGLMTVRARKAGDGWLYVSGGRKLDQSFVDSFVLPEGMKVALVEVASKPGGPPHAEIPLKGRDGGVLATFVVTHSPKELLALKNDVRSTGALVGAAGVLFGVALSWWAASRVTRPLTELTSSVREVAEGRWDTRVRIDSRDEVGQLARDFNHMTQQLIEQRERTIQAERVAAWRELARRLAHELKNPLFPLQITIENLQRARHSSPEQFEEVFRESTATLLAELQNLKMIIGRFSDFARMPAPQREQVDLNALIRDVMRLFDAQFHDPARAPIEVQLDLQPDLTAVQADPEQLRRALRNLVLNALDAMPNGGAIAVRTRPGDAKVSIEISDTGAGLTPEECERLFTPYYTTKHHGTGLGLAIVQSVVSDHGGAICVSSAPGKGATFRIELQTHEQTPAG